VKQHICYLPLFFFLGGAGDWSQDLTLAQCGAQVLHTWDTPPSPFCFGYFGVALYVLACLDCNPPICVSLCSHVPPCPPTGWDGVSHTFRPGWSETAVFLISVFWVARITGVSHCSQPLLSFLGIFLKPVFKHVSYFRPGIWARLASYGRGSRGVESSLSTLTCPSVSFWLRLSLSFCSSLHLLGLSQPHISWLLRDSGGVQVFASILSHSPQSITHPLLAP
jgi:hypothetical protein